MKKSFLIIFSAMFLFMTSAVLPQQDFTRETKRQKDERMKWWRDARFGMFIHWGLYAIPAGEWGNGKDHAEWIRTTAQIPIDQYEKFLGQFNPVKFNADEWVKMAKDAGMKYIVITSKHHDGFNLFDSPFTDFDVMSTPFHRDIMKELSEAAHKAGIKICWYHSIMDWHHPDYLPRRDWEKDRPTKTADFKKYVEYLKNELKVLVTKYGDIGILWFDGEWESTWTHELGKDLYNYVRSLQPAIIINNRVDTGRSGMEGQTKSNEFVGDYGTPEQEIPATGLPNTDWETCMTMNDHWGYNKYDKNFKTTEDLLQKLADIASKGGNFLLNIGPTSEGVFPPESIQRLKEIGEWMKVNGESIYSTTASPFKTLEWGRCTQKIIEGGTRLYLHVFDWPKDGKLVVPGIYNKSMNAYLLSDPDKNKLDVTRKEDALVISVPNVAPDKINSVVVLDVLGTPDISYPPEIKTTFDKFLKEIIVDVASDRKNIEIRYTTDGTIPESNSKLLKGSIILKNTATIKARCFRNGKPVSGIAEALFTKVVPEEAVKAEKPKPGLKFDYYEGKWDKLPDFINLKTVKSGTIKNFDISIKNQPEYFGVQFTGYINILNDDVYKFYTSSDDGSSLYIDDKLVVDNDGLHGAVEKSGTAALAKGYHKIIVMYFNKTGGFDLSVSYETINMKKQAVPVKCLFN